MKKILIFGNSGSGKSTLAQQHVKKFGLSHLDLDGLAWLNTKPPQRKSIADSAKAIEKFTTINENWVIEGCYSDLLNLIINQASEVIFINPGIAACIKNCQSRPWEPHKYKTPKQQDENLPMLINWVKAYKTRDDEFSLKSHSLLFKQFKGNKTEYNSNVRNNNLKS
jgi:adenylate kinase family enzyme